ncbi:hypothetical protein GCM10009798_05660 [Nocardioides panacihumi]|uniref:HIRAN domain-containing protein n=1 Tax=Nocardioides panacihumi TaxID=400774 RepID=A0ABN2QC03_9ACTN
MSSSVMETAAATSTETVSRLMVTVRDSEARRYRPVGFLTYSGDGFSFAYLRREIEREGFRPLPGLARATEGPMHSATLFPLFAERVISSRRPDRQTSLDALGLPADAAPFEVLVRSHGQRVGDTIELLPAPVASPGDVVSFTFLAHGVRHLPEAHQARITELGVGEPLLLRAEMDNPVNPRAQLVTDTDAITLGWLPDPLIDVVQALSGCELAVERANGPEVGFHFRLLARIRGQLSTGQPLFAGSDWETVERAAD